MQGCRALGVDLTNLLHKKGKGFTNANLLSRNLADHYGVTTELNSKFIYAIHHRAVSGPGHIGFLYCRNGEWRVIQAGARNGEMSITEAFGRRPFYYSPLFLLGRHSPTEGT